MINILSLVRLAFEDPLNYFSQLRRIGNTLHNKNNHADRLWLKKQIISQYRDYFSDQGNLIEIAYEADHQSVGSLQIHYSVSIFFDKNTTFYICITLRESLLLKIGESLNPGLSSRSDDEASENFAQLVHNLNYSVCRSARRSGCKVKHGAVQNYLPHCDESVLAHCYIQ